MTTQRRSLVRGLISAAVALALGLGAFVSLGRWLVVSDPMPQRLDALFVFGGDSHRDQYLIQLSSRYPDARLVVSGQNRTAYFARLAKSSVDTNRVTFVDTCTRTLSELRFLEGWAENQVKPAGAAASGSPVKIGLISSPYHMRRISMLGWFILQREHVDTAYLPVPESQYTWQAAGLQGWWKVKQLRQIVATEYGKMAADLAALAGLG